MLPILSADAWRTGFIWLLCLTAAWALLWYFVPYLSVTTRLKKAARELANRDGEGPKRGLLPRSLAGTIPLLRPNPLPGLWDRYVRAWRESAVSAEGPGGILPSEVFTKGSVLGGRGQAIPAALAGVFVGLGLLGTFVGISVGLSQIDLTTNDPSRLMTGVSGLMEGMSAAFDTSIVGMFFSLLWLLGFRWVRHSLEVHLAAFCEAVEVVVPYEDPQRTLFRMADSVERSASSLQTLGGDITEALEGAMERSVTPALAGMAEAVNELSEGLSDQQFEGVERMVDSFRASLSETLNEDLGRLGEGLRSASEQQEQTVERMTLFFERLEAVSESQTALLSRTVEVSETFSSGLESLTKAQQSIQATGETSDQMMRDAAVLMEEARSQSEVFREASAALEETLASRIDSANRHVQEVATFWEDFENKVERMTTELSGSLTELTTFTAQKIGEVFETFDGEMAKITEHLAGTLSELRTATESLPAASDQIAQAMERLPSTLERAADEFEKVAGMAQGAAERTRDDLEKLSDRLERVADAASEKVVPLHESLPAMSRDAQQLAEAFSTTGTQIGALREELEKARNGASKTFFDRIRGA